MRKITRIIVHCTATKAGREVTVAEIDSWHRARGFRCIGYHYVVNLSGDILTGRPEGEVGAHCLGQNSCSIGVAYVGGLDTEGIPADTRTPQQKSALLRLVSDLKARYPSATVHSHYEFAAKSCPCFNAGKEYNEMENI